MCICEAMNDNQTPDKIRKKKKNQKKENKKTEENSSQEEEDFTEIRDTSTAEVVLNRNTDSEIVNDTESLDVKKHKKKKKEAYADITVDKTSTESDSTDSHSLLQVTVKSDYDFFKGVLGTIPPSALASQYVKDDSDEDSSEALGEKGSKKRKRKDQGQGPLKKQKNSGKSQPSSSNQPQNSLASGNEDVPYSKVKEKQMHKSNKKKNDKKSKRLVDSAELAKAADRMQLLKEKLQERILELQAKRGKLTPEEAQEKKRLKRKESKMKLKIRRRAEKQGKKIGDNPSQVASGSNGGVVSTSPAKPAVVDKGGKLVFSKFDFSESGKLGKSEKKSKSGLVGKDYKRLLEKIEKRNEKINKLKETDADKAKKLEDKTKWQTAMLKAEGERVKDDVKLLHKGLKTKQKQKEKRKKKWKERENQVKKRQDQRQEKREKHIKERKQAAIDKKIKKAKKKGRIVPGF